MSKVRTRRIPVDNVDPVAASIDTANGWFRAAAIAAVARAIAWVALLFAVASLVSARLDRHANGGSLTWLVLGGTALVFQVVFGSASSLLSSRGGGAVESELRNSRASETL